MILIILLMVLLGGVLVWALYAEEVLPRPIAPRRRLDPAMTGAELAQHSFPLVPVGYDPRRVDAHLRELGRIHDQLRRRVLPWQDLGTNGGDGRHEAHGGDGHAHEMPVVGEPQRGPDGPLRSVLDD